MTEQTQSNLYVLGFMFTENRGLSFIYKSHKNVMEAYERAMPEPSVTLGLPTDETLIRFADDYGQVATIRRASIIACWVEDVAKVSEGNIERNLHNARSQVFLNRRAANDPVLKTQAMVAGDALRMNGPARFAS
jgi:hypothetical protein